MSEEQRENKMVPIGILQLFLFATIRAIRDVWFDNLTFVNETKSNENIGWLLDGIVIILIGAAISYTVIKLYRFIRNRT